MLQKLMVPFLSNQACLLLLQGDAITFVLGWSKGMKKAQLLKLINDKMEQGSASGQGAQVRPILIPSDPHHSLRPKPVCLRFKSLRMLRACRCHLQVLLTFQRGQVGFRCGRRLTMSGKCEAILQCSDTQQWQPIEEVRKPLPHHTNQ